MYDGPHVDAKTARRIRREERLWFTISSRGFLDHPQEQSVSVTNPQPDAGQVMWSLDYRILGAMRRSSQRSTF